MNKVKPEEIIRSLNGLNHETLAHKMFQRCFQEAIKAGKIRGLEKSSLFRSTLAYFLLVPSARERFLRELTTVKV
jgi:hypothetical protein